MATATRQRSAPMGEGIRFGRLPAEELSILKKANPNVLIIGTCVATADALKALRPRFRPPIVTWRAGTPLVLPPAAWANTLILDEVASLSVINQQRLLDWLQRSDRTGQVVATSSIWLHPLVERREFLEALYYRLNVIYLEVASSGS